MTNIDKINLLNIVDTKDGWRERKRIVIEKTKIYTNLEELIMRANKNELSLAVFKPNQIIDFLYKEVEREWSKEKLKLLKAKSQQLSLFQTPEEVEYEFSVVPKLPYKFSYKLSDDSGRESTLMIEDWEIGMLYWNCLRESPNEEEALIKVRQKYLEEFSRKDIFLFLGTTKQFHGWTKNPFVIIGVFYPPRQEQIETFKKKINELTVQDKGSAEIRDYIKLRQTRPFVVKEQGFLVPQKSLFNKIIGDSHLELLFASFLEKCTDVISYAKNYLAVHFTIDYMNADGNISNYYPDFIVKTSDKDLFIVETKGLEDPDVPLKMTRLKKWCEDINASQKKACFDYVFVDEEDFNKYKPDSFSSLINNFRKYKDDKTG